MTPNQLNVFAPSLLDASKAVEVLVQVDDAVSPPVALTVANAAPGLATTNQTGTGQGAILNQDGSLNSGANPAHLGSVISLYGTGAGPLTMPFYYLDGSLAISTPYPLVAQPISVTIGGEKADVEYAGVAPFLPIGIVQINARVPPNSMFGDVPIEVTVGGVTSTKRVTAAVR